jgi:hypothetical protein
MPGIMLHAIGPALTRTGSPAAEQHGRTDSTNAAVAWTRCIGDRREPFLNLNSDKTPKTPIVSWASPAPTIPDGSPSPGSPSV